MSRWLFYCAKFDIIRINKGVYMNWFDDESIIKQEAVNVSNGKAETTGISLIVGGTEVVLELEQLKSAVKYLES